ncbi:unnamed protein product [Rangifer tarandus platyrhynchus]|uniref:Uncharacterized protein n=1 Tax=Rangifer tarandus platyrhynchus TaxID=3082113 RepID=A0ABN8XPH1_RANTA|nr:unnamed protein product [Rangifer tarandus platyrhynchus]
MDSQSAKSNRKGLPSLSRVRSGHPGSSSSFSGAELGRPSSDSRGVVRQLVVSPGVRRQGAECTVSGWGGMGNRRDATLRLGLQT